MIARSVKSPVIRLAVEIFAALTNVEPVMDRGRFGAVQKDRWLNGPVVPSLARLGTANERSLNRIFDMGDKKDVENG